MNKIFKVIYSKVRNCYVVTSEFAKANTKSSTGSTKQTAKKSLLSLAIAMGIAGGGFVNVGAAETVEAQITGGATATVYTKEGTESYVDQALNEKIEAEKNTRVEFDQALNEKIEAEMQARSESDQALNQKIEANTTAIDGFKAKDTELEGNIQTNKDAITATNKRTAGIDRIDATSETTIEKNVKVDNLGNVTAKGDVTAKGKLIGDGVAAGAGDITTTGAVNAGSLNVTDASHLKGDVTMDKKLSVTGDTTLKGTKVDGKLTVTDDADLKNTEVNGTLTTTGKATFKEAVEMDKGLTVTTGATMLKATTVDGTLTAGDAELKNTTVNGTLGVTGETTLNDKLTAKGEATFEKNVIAEKDLTVNGKLNVGEIYLENNKLESTGKKHDSATAITADGISNLAKVTELGHTTESQFTHNEKGTFNYAKDGGTTDWTETRSDVTANGVTTEVKDSKGNRTNTSQTADGIKGYATDKDGNKTYTKVTATENSFQIQDKDGKNKNHQVNTKDSSVTEITNEDGKTTKTEQTATDITNTAKDGTIKNDAKNIVNNASGDMTNTVGGKLTTTVTGQATETYNGGLDTNVTGTENHTVTGAQNIHVTGNQTNEVGGNQTTTVAGDISNSAKNIVNTADESITNNAKVINNKASEVINNEAVNINNKASGIISSSASEIKNQADKLISNKVGENTYQNIENGKITESIKDGIKQNLTQSDADKTEHSVVNGENATVNKQTSEELTGAVTNGSSSNVIQNTAISSNNTIADWDAAGKPTKANSVISTVDGTTFSNTEANTVLTAKKDLGKDFTNTTIKGNTITTGQATMDYAEVMKDLGVKGNANITGKTTTGSLEVTGTSTLKGDVTMESNATVKKDLTVEGTTTTKDLHVTNNATITGDVTANSYKVGNNTYIDANGINANNQKVTNVADGTIAEGSKDAVNGGQLFETNRRIDQFDSRINEVGANAAAMANLHPMEFDADSKLNVAVGVGNYRNKTATAMGLFYRPNEDVMFNVSSTIGSSDNMIGGGVSFRLGSGGNKLKNKAFADAAEQNKQLKSQVDTLQAQMDALLSVINPNMSKDFPDVPDNHWAYEAVSRLAGNDIIQGYEDGKYHGERTMTRYEMAVIIYKALQKGIKAEAKLVEEFKPELKAIAAHEKA